MKSLLDYISRPDPIEIVYIYWHPDFELYEVTLTNHNCYLCPSLTYIDGLIQVPEDCYKV